MEFSELIFRTFMSDDGLGQKGKARNIQSSEFLTKVKFFNSHECFLKGDICQCLEKVFDLAIGQGC